MRIELVWKEALVLALLAALLSGSIAVAAMLSIDDRTAQGAVGIGGLILVTLLINAFGTPWVRRRSERRAGGR